VPLLIRGCSSCADSTWGTQLTHDRRLLHLTSTHDNFKRTTRRPGSGRLVAVRQLSTAAAMACCTSGRTPLIDSTEGALFDEEEGGLVRRSAACTHRRARVGHPRQRRVFGKTAGGKTAMPRAPRRSRGVHAGFRSWQRNEGGVYHACGRPGRLFFGAVPRSSSPAAAAVRRATRAQHNSEPPLTVRWRRRTPCSSVNVPGSSDRYGASAVLSQALAALPGAGE
jgi:hypothetical protein